MMGRWALEPYESRDRLGIVRQAYDIMHSHAMPVLISFETIQGQRCGLAADV